MGRAAEVTASEREGSPVVGELIVTNTGAASALLLEGEILEGGWQHRALRHDIILRGGGSMVAPVVCVEAGRWRGGERHSRGARRASGNLRSAMSTPNESERQARVWREVAAYDQALGASPTSSYVDHLDRLHKSVDSLVVPVLDGQRGVIVGLAGQPVLLELFPNREWLISALPDLLAGLLVDAMSAGAPTEITPGRRARRLIERLEGSQPLHAQDLDCGAAEPYTLMTPYLAFRGITLDDEWAHLSAFNRRHALVGAF